MALLNLLAFSVLLLFRKTERRNKADIYFCVHAVILATACCDERLELLSYFLRHDILLGDVLTG